jgi:hypothetical protein
MRIAAMAVLGGILSVGACAQGNDSCNSDGAKDPDKTFLISKKEVRCFEPSLPQRFLRAWEYQFQFEEQPLFVVATSNGSTQIVQNPEKYLKQNTITFQFSELFPNTTNLAPIVGAIYKSSAGSNKDQKQLLLDPGLCGNANTLKCLASGGSGFGNFMERFLSSVTVNVSLSERNEIQQGIVVPNLPASLHYGPGGEVDFDPASLFITGSNWKRALDALKDMKYPSTLFFKDKDDESNCFVKPLDNPTTHDEGWEDKNRTRCGTEFGTPRFAAAMTHPKWTYLGALLIPKFKFQAVSQFDYIKNGGVLVSFPGLQRSLKNYSFTWNFRQAIASTADRLAVLTAYQTYSPPPPKANVANPKLCITINGASRGYVPVADAFDSNGCRTIAKNSGAKEYALACATSSSVDIGPSVVVEDLTLVERPDLNQCKW